MEENDHTRIDILTAISKLHVRKMEQPSSFFLNIYFIYIVLIEAQLKKNTWMKKVHAVGRSKGE